MTNKVQRTISENTKGTATRAVLLLTAIVAALMLSSGMALAITKTCEDSLATRLGLIRHAPQAIKLDKGWTRGVPDRWPAVGEYLRQRTGHSFPVLSHLRHRRAVRAIATMIKENLSRSESVIGLDDKLAAGLIYADTIGNPALAHENCARSAPGGCPTRRGRPWRARSQPARPRWTKACSSHRGQSHQRESSNW